ncbi:hypothetical protein [Spirosoma aerophilum]
MLLSFTSVDEQANIRECAWWFNTIEAAFEALNAVFAKGNHIIQAALIDDEKRTALPVDAFDGDSVSAPMQELENEWQQLLGQPLKPQSVNREF